MEKDSFKVFAVTWSVDVRFPFGHFQLGNYGFRFSFGSHIVPENLVVSFNF